MPISVKFVVQSDDIEEARAWAEEATGLVAQGHESTFWGDYYAFEGSAGEDMKLITNRDPIDGELIVGNNPACLVVLIVDEAEVGSPVLQALQHAPQRFEKLEESSY